MKAIANLEKLEANNWKAISELDDRMRGSLLCFLFGYFKADEKFQSGVQWWLAHLPRQDDKP